MSARRASGYELLTVQLQRTGELLAVLELGPGAGSLRASSRCEER